MSTEEPAASENASHHHLDADAVCAQCGTTNPEGTLICRHCGNNLRDQRQLRMQAEAVLLGHERTPVWRWVARGIIAVMVLVLPLVALNADNFFSWLVAYSEGGVAERYWNGTDAPFYDGLRRELDAAFPEGGSPPTPQGTLGSTPDGFYLLVDPLSGPVGVAIARTRESRVGFVARLDAGIEIRGTASVRDGRYLAQPDEVGVKQGRHYVRARGNAGPRPAGGLMCFGQSETSERILNCVAFPLPAPVAR